MVDVVREPHVHAARGRARQRALDDPGQRIRQADVVDRDLERSLCRIDEVRERLRRALGRLAAV
jgi:hypothetical protein